MKIAHNKFLRLVNALIAGILGVMGFSSCDILPVAEYGVPSADYIVNGNVSSMADDQGIENIRVIFQQDTVLTNAEGNYQVINNNFPSDIKFSILFQDIDSIQNGSYNSLDTLVDFSNVKFTGGDGSWYSGEASVEFDVKLRPKE